MADAPTAERIVGPIQADDDVLRVEHVAKRFGPTIALRDINLHLRKGEVLGLLGDNGAGKSTLIKIICGFQKAGHRDDVAEGRRLMRPRPCSRRARAGVDTVYQDLALVDQLSVYQNMFLFREKVHKPIPFLANREMKRSHARGARTRPGSISRGSMCRWRDCPAVSARRSRWRGRSPATPT